MNNERWLLPEGIEELLPPQAQQLENLRRRLLDLFFKWGYELVMPPLVEYLESLLTGTGNDLNIQTFKLTDQLSGRLMGVRADITPQVARINAHRMGNREGPVRLCYQGTVLHTRGDGLGGSRSFTQIGAELYGHPTIESDTEVVCLMLEALEVAGIEQVYLDLGHVGIFRGITTTANISKDQETILFDALQRKAVTEIQNLSSEFGLDGVTSQALESLVWLNGGDEVLDEARKCLGFSEGAIVALKELEEVAKRLSKENPDIILHFDLAELRGFHYHTGVVFAAYQMGQGRAIAQGGRYDDIGKVFGRARPATGFSADLRALANLGRSENAQDGGIFAPSNDDDQLGEKVKELRASGQRVVYELEGQSGGASEAGCDRILAFSDGEWIVKDYK